jgi:F-box protein 9
MLKPTLRAKGLHIGTYTLAPIDNGPNDSEPDAKATPRPNRRIIISELLEPGNPVPKYEFEMELSLRETSRGRWNKLDITSYQSVNLATGEVLGLALKHQKPFYFSK